MGKVGDFVKERLPRSGKDILLGPASSADIKATKEGLESIGVKKPHVDAVDPAAERAKAAAEATASANMRIAFMRKAQRENSLMTGGGAAASGSGRSTLGV